MSVELTGLVDTIYVGRLGSMQLAGVGIALSVFNTATRLLNTPLLSVATSSVAAAVGREQQKKQAQQNQHDFTLQAALTSGETNGLPVESESHRTESGIRSSENTGSGSSSSSTSLSQATSSTQSSDIRETGQMFTGAQPEADEVSLVASSVLLVACIAGVVQVR